MKYSNDVINGNTILDGYVTVDGNVVITGKVNGIDLSNYNASSPVVNNQVALTEDQLSATLENQCSALNVLTLALEGNPFDVYY